MSLKSSIITYLNTVDGLADLVEDRISFNRAEQNDGSPRITVMQVDGAHQHHMTAATGKVIGRFQFDCHADKPIAAASVAEQLRLALDGYRGSMGDAFVSMCHLVDERDVELPPIEGAHTGISTVQQDYMIGWAVTVPTFV